MRGEQKYDVAVEGGRVLWVPSPWNSRAWERSSSSLNCRASVLCLHSLRASRERQASLARLLPARSALSCHTSVLLGNTIKLQRLWGTGIRLWGGEERALLLLSALKGVQGQLPPWTLVSKFWPQNKGGKKVQNSCFGLWGWGGILQGLWGDKRP